MATTDLVGAVRLVQLCLQSQHLRPDPAGAVHHLVLRGGAPLHHRVPSLHHQAGPCNDFNQFY